jgi:hypothetical protein
MRPLRGTWTTTPTSPTSPGFQGLQGASGRHGCGPGARYRGACFADGALSRQNANRGEPSRTRPHRFVATIGTQGVVGETFLLIHPGSSPAPRQAPLSLLPSKEPMDISNLLDQGQGLRQRCRWRSQGRGWAAEKDGRSTRFTTLNNANSTLANVDDVVAGLKQGKARRECCCRTQPWRGQIRQTMTNVQQASTDSESAFHQGQWTYHRRSVCATSRRRSMTP